MDHRFTGHLSAPDVRWIGYFFKTTNIDSQFHQVDKNHKKIIFYLSTRWRLLHLNVSQFALRHDKVTSLPGTTNSVASFLLSTICLGIRRTDIASKSKLESLRMQQPPSCIKDRHRFLFDDFFTPWWKYEF